MTRRLRFAAALMAVLAAALAAAATGSAERTDAATPAATLPKQTIGYVNFLKGIESADRIERAALAAAKALGWTLVVCDGKGDPTQMTRCVDSLLTRGVDAIVTNAIDATLITAPLRRAQQKKVPAIAVGGLVSPSPLYSGVYYPDEKLAGRVLARYLIKQVNAKVSGNKTIAINDYPVSWCKTRTIELRSRLESTKIKVVADQTTDATNIIEGTRRQTTDELTRNPNLSAYWFCFDTAGQAGGQAVLAKYRGKSFPNKPLVATFHADKGTQALMRKGAIDVVVDNNYDAGSWIGMDQLAQFFAKKQAFSKSPQPKYPVVYYHYTVVTKANLPKPGTYVEPKDDYVAFFKAKWKKEFGTR